MSRLLEDLLDVARIDGGSLRIEPEPIDVAALLTEVAADFTLLADIAGVTIHLDFPASLPPFQGDRARLVQALSNLLSNALKFTPRAGEVRIAARHEASGLRIEIADSGCGIDSALLEKVFDAFWQADPSNRNGAGLGLHIVRGIIESHGGHVRVRSSSGAGATFEIELPLSQSP